MCGTLMKLAHDLTCLMQVLVQTCSELPCVRFGVRNIYRKKLAQESLSGRQDLEWMSQVLLPICRLCAAIT